MGIAGIDTGRPFTRAEALKVGLTDKVLRGPAYQRVFHGVYVGRDVVVDHRLRAEAALTVCPPGSWVSHLTSALIWDLWPPEHSLIHVTVTDDVGGSRRRGIRSHEMSPSREVTVVDGLPASTPIQTFLELGECVDLVDLVVVGDRIVALGHATPAELVAAADAWFGRGARLVRRAARFVRRGVDSPMESRLRMLLVLAGLPEPEVDHRLFHADGTLWMRFDLYYPRCRLIVEYDGRQHADDPGQWLGDITRREALDGLGERILVVVSKDLFVVPERTLVRVRNALVERGAVDVPLRFRPEWRHYFGASRRRLRVAI